jgi:hypothetical protein
VRWALPGLNTRETALAFWLAVFLVFVLLKPGVRRGFASLGKLIFTSTLLFGVIASAAAYAGACAYALDRVGYLDQSMVALAAVWFSFALAVTFTTRNVDASYYRKVLLRNLGAAALIEFVVNVHTFPLPVELVLVPLSIIFVLMLTVAEGNPEFEQMRKLLAWVAVVPGLVAIVYSINYVARNWSDAVTAEKVKELFLPFVLTAVFLPFAVATKYFVVWQTMLHMIKAGLDDDVNLYRFSRRRVINACGLSLAKAQLFESDYRGRLWGAEDEAAVDAVIARFEARWRRGRRVSADAQVCDASLPVS